MSNDIYIHWTSGEIKQIPMIVEINEQTGEAITYKSLDNFLYAHNNELCEKYEKRFQKTPTIDIFPQTLERIQDMLPNGTSKITKIHEHTSHIVVNCENGEVHSFDKIGEHPYLKFRK